MEAGSQCGAYLDVNGPRGGSGSDLAAGVCVPCLEKSGEARVECARMECTLHTADGEYNHGMQGTVGDGLPAIGVAGAWRGGQCCGC